MKNLFPETSFNKNLRQIRKEKGLSQPDLAKLTGLTVRMISYYENEATKPPIDKINLLAQALNVSINKLLGTADKTNEIQDELSKIDARTLKKIKLILSLTKQERHILYSMADTFIKSRKQRKKDIAE